MGGECLDVRTRKLGVCDRVTVGLEIVKRDQGCYPKQESEFEKGREWVGAQRSFDHR